MRRHEYGDPLEILIQREAGTCKGCKHAAIAFDRHYCDKGKQYGRRCKQYIELTGVDMLQRVKKADVKISDYVKPDGLDVCLDAWKRSMHHDDRNLSVQGQKLLRGEGDGYGNEDTGQARRDNEIAAATGAMIGGLRAHHRWAIHKSAGIATTWIFPQLDFTATATEAREELQKKLQNNIVTRTLF